MNQITLPPEILNYIFSFLDNDHNTWSTLKASLSCSDPVFRDVIIRRLYTHIVVTNFKWNGPGLFYYSNLYHYLSRNRYVAQYVRTLQIEIELPGPSQWYNKVASVLRMLPSSLKAITLSCRTRLEANATVPVQIVWSDLHETFRKAFLDCLWSPTIIDASMHCIAGFPLSIFNPCTQLQRLSFWQVDCTPSTSEAQFPPKIVSFVAGRSPSSAMILSWAKTGHSLRSLSFRGIDYELLTGLLDSYSDTLIELELNFVLYTSSYFRREGRFQLILQNSPLTLSHNRKLTQLTVCAYIHYRSDWVYSPIPFIPTLVNTSPSLKRLILCVTMDPRYFDITTAPDFWRDLESLVDHPALEHIELGISEFPGKEAKLCQGIDIISSLMKVPELKKMCKEGFLSMREIDDKGLFWPVILNKLTAYQHRI